MKMRGCLYVIDSVILDQQIYVVIDDNFSTYFVSKSILNDSFFSSKAVVQILPLEISPKRTRFVAESFDLSNIGSEIYLRYSSWGVEEA